MLHSTTNLYYFCRYQAFYYSASSNPWEAAYINCFDSSSKQVGRIIFTNPDTPVPAGQTNRMDASFGVVIYYPLSRFNDVVNLLRYAVNNNYCDCSTKKEKHEVQPEEQSVFFSVNEELNTWALCNNHYMAVGAQYHV